METKRLIFKVHLQWAHFSPNSINTATAAEKEMGKNVIPSQ